MKEAIKLSRNDISDLNKLINSIKSRIDEIEKKNPKLEKGLKLKKKFIGVLGEAIGLVKLFKKYGSSYKYYWHGGRKKDFDVVLTKGNEEIKIQIKSSADEKFRFRTIRVDVDNPNKVIQEIKK
jgi:predicted AAA+ superfamily ATPase